MELRGVNYIIQPQISIEDSYENMMVQGYLPATTAAGIFDENESFITYGIVPEEVNTISSFPQIIRSGAASSSRFTIGADGSIIPLIEATTLGSISGNTLVMLAAGDPEEDQDDEPTVPSHILDHMYARKRKSLDDATPSKQKKRVRKKTPAVAPKKESERSIPEIAITRDSTKVNIIRKNVNTASLTTRVPCFQRPKILQNFKQKVTDTSTNPLESDDAEISFIASSESPKSVPRPLDDVSIVPSSKTISAFLSSNKLVPARVSANVAEPSHSVQLTADSLQSNNETCLVYQADANDPINSFNLKTDSPLIQFVPVGGIPNTEPGEVLGEVAVFSLCVDDVSCFPQTMQNDESNVKFSTKYNKA